MDIAVAFDVDFFFEEHRADRLLTEHDRWLCAFRWKIENDIGKHRNYLAWKPGCERQYAYGNSVVGAYIGDMSQLSSHDFMRSDNRVENALVE